MPGPIRIECPHCQCLVPAQIDELLPGAVRFRCGECKRDMVADTFAPAKQAPGDDAPRQRCPKCKVAMADAAQACNSCGLALARFADFQPSLQEFDSGLEDAWSRLCADWDRDELHELFLTEVARGGAYGEAARRYRIAADEPGQKTGAEARLARIQSMAAAALLSSRPKVAPAEEPFRNVLVLLILLVVIAGAGGLYAIMKGKSQVIERTHAPVGRR